MPAVAAPIKISWHASGRWHRAIGKRLNKERTKLVPDQRYLGADYDLAVKKALALKAQWKSLVNSWKKDHESVLKKLGDPFASAPHWYAFKTVNPETALDDIGEPVADPADARVINSSVPSSRNDLPQPDDIDISECAKLLRAYRASREGKDFKSESNRSFETDIDGALMHIDMKLKVSKLRGFIIKQFRQSLEDNHKARTAYNYGMAFKAMLRWYFRSELFDGGIEPKGLDEEFSRFIKPAARKPRHIKTETVKFILGKATKQRRLYLLLMLNCGMQPTDIPMLLTRRFNLETGVVKWYRKKNRRLRGRRGRMLKNVLWPETLKLVKEMISKSGRAFRTVNGDPLFHVTAKRNRHNAVTNSLDKYFERLRKKFQIHVTAKNFRQTGAQLIYKATRQYDLTRIWLGREFATEDKPYLTEIGNDLGKASMRVHRRLTRLGVFSGAAEST